ncbi:MAG: hypothetical protein WD025_02310 [Bacteriovoracaceae bacterium]
MDKRTLSRENNEDLAGLELLEKFKARISKYGRKELDLVNKKLNFLCLEFDPYNDLERSQEEQNIIDEYELNDSLNNPFNFTNIILQMLDALETEIKSRSH